MKAAAEEANDSAGQKPLAKTPKTITEPGAATAGSPLSLEHWAMLARNFSNVLKDDSILLDETANSTSSNETKEIAGPDSSPHAHHVQGGSSTGNSAHSATPHSSPSRLTEDTEMVDTNEPRNQLENLLRLEEQRHSPDENLNVSNFPKLFGQGQDFATLFGLTSLLSSSSGSGQNSSSTSQTPSATATATVTIKSGSELAKALGKSNGRHAGSSSSASNGLSQLDFTGSQINEFMKNCMKNNWQMPDDCKSF